MSAGNDRRRRHASVDDESIDPSRFFEPHRSARDERKVQQLCKEVARTLAYALPACGDPLLAELVIVAVTPAPDAARLAVTLAPPTPRPLAVAELRERIARVRGRLRGEIAAALQRKRTPELAFHIAPAATEDEP